LLCFLAPRTPMTTIPAVPLRYNHDTTQSHCPDMVEICKNLRRYAEQHKRELKYSDAQSVFRTKMEHEHRELLHMLDGCCQCAKCLPLVEHARQELQELFCALF